MLSGQTKGNREIPGLQSDLLVPPPVDHPWTTVEQAYETRHRGGHLTITTVHKPLAIANMFFSFLQNFGAETLSQYYWRLAAWCNT